MPRRFDFVSPGIQLTEIDESTLPAELVGDGPLIVGLASKGPANKPVRITSKENFNSIFGAPVYGPLATTYPDSWRNGSYVFPFYGTIAADAWLSAEESPITFIRLLGEEATDRNAATGQAGWITSKTEALAQASNGGAYGLFIINSGSGDLAASGTLAAVWYLEQGKIELSGTVAGHGAGAIAAQGAGVLIESLDSSGVARNTFKVVITDASSSATENFTFDFDPESASHIRKVFNTEAYTVNSTTEPTATRQTYWIGETFEESVDRYITTSGKGEQYGIIVALASGSSNWADHRGSYTTAKSGWFINRDPNSDGSSYDAATAEKLFRLVGLHDGIDFAKDITIRIKDLFLGTTQNPNSTFTLEILDFANNILETYSRLTLNPADDNFIGRRVGTQYREWNATDKKYSTKGKYPNLSDYVYVELTGGLVGVGATDTNALPFGYIGPNKFKGFSIVSGSDAPRLFNDGGAFAKAYVKSTGSMPAPETAAAAPPTGEFAYLNTVTTASFIFPDIKQSIAGAWSTGGNFPVNDGVSFGMRPYLNNKINKDHGYVDLVRNMPTGYDVHATPVASDNYETSYIFTLDELIYDATNQEAYWEAGSRAGGTSYTATSGTQALVDLTFNGFDAPFFGGSDGLDIREKNPFSTANIATDVRSTSYEYNTIQKVIDIAKDPENVSMDLFTMPGITKLSIMDDMLAATAERGDSLAIIDSDVAYKTLGDGTTESAGTVSGVVSSVRGRNYNNSYGAIYHPWVLLDNSKGANIYGPPSIAAIGAMASSQKSTAPWFAPAGFNRGGLEQLGGAGGPRVVGVAETVNKANRDKLYQYNINPIANFGGNIVIFGQKTLQAVPSALDRINVRRLMIYVKKRIGAISETILFDQNINTTWRRFTSAASAVLDDVQAGGGITEYKLILDSTTTTPDLQDRNIMYAKVMIKPARAIEFIAVDFVITRSGVQF
jgi:hypothetical protein